MGNINNISGAIVKSLLEDLTDRRGFKGVWYDTDTDIQKEIKATWFKIIRNRIKLLDKEAHNDHCRTQGQRNNYVRSVEGI